MQVEQVERRPITNGQKWQMECGAVFGAMGITKAPPNPIEQQGLIRVQKMPRSKRGVSHDPHPISPARQSWRPVRQRREGPALLAAGSAVREGATMKYTPPASEYPRYLGELATTRPLSNAQRLALYYLKRAHPDYRKRTFYRAWSGERWGNDNATVV